jgi:hypothetical protein
MREWVLYFIDGHFDAVYCQREFSEMPEIGEGDEELVHVIEKSAYEQLRAEVERLKNTYEPPEPPPMTPEEEAQFDADLKSISETTEFKQDIKDLADLIKKKAERSRMADDYPRLVAEVKRLNAHNQQLLEPALQHIADVGQLQSALEEVERLNAQLKDHQPFDAYYAEWEVERGLTYEELKKLKAELDVQKLLVHEVRDHMKEERDQLKSERVKLKAELDFCKQQWDGTSRIWEQRCDKLTAEVESLSIKIQRTVNASEHALLEMSAWMGIPEKKREAQIEALMENVHYCAEHDLRDVDESQAVRDLKRMSEGYKAIGLKLLSAYWDGLAQKIPFPENTDLIKEARKALEEK